MRKPTLKLGMLSDYRAACYGFCAVWIVLFHARIDGCDFSFGVEELSGINTMLALGNFGVDIFLLLSGVSCYFSWIKRQDPGLFLKKRLVRIVPAVLLICGSFWALWVLAGEMHWTRFLYNATLVLSKTIILCVSVLFGYWMLHKYNLSLFWNMEIMVARIPTFCIGAYLGHLVKERKAFGFSVWLCVAVTSVAYLAYAVLAFPWVESNCWWWRATMMPGGAIGSLLVCGMFNTLNGLRFVKRATAFFCVTGGFSLELYVAHIMCFWSRGLLPSIGGSVATALALACLSWVIAYSANRILYVWSDGGVVSLTGENR